jgi:signal transduction histidine kinase
MLDAVQDYLCPIKLNFETVDLCQTAATIATDFGRRFPGVRIAVESSGSCICSGDPERLHQVARAILNNAAEAGAQRITMRAFADQSAGTAHWFVSDNGTGMPPEKTPQLFSPFFTTRTGHAGLGLALVRKLILLHGGQVTAGNRHRDGFEVEMSLLLASAE